MDKETDVSKIYEAVETVDENLFEEYSELTEHRMLFDIRMKRHADGTWETLGDLTVSASRDSTKFGSVNVGMKSYDDTSEKGVYTIMTAISRYIGTEEFIKELLSKIKEAELEG